VNTIRILWVTNTSMIASEVIKTHSHEYYSLFCVQYGVFHFSLDKETHVLIKDDFILAPKGVSHSIFGLQTDHIDVQEIKFIINDSELASYVDELPLKPIRNNQSANDTVNRIVDEYMKFGQYADKSAASYLSTLLYTLTSEIRYSDIDDKSSEMIDIKKYPAPIQKIHLYIEEHFSEELPLDVIAENVMLNKSYMCSVFKKYVGVTIGEWINVVRIRKAAEMIIYSDLSLMQIALNCGYVSTAHFNRLFQKYVGIPPGQCRRSYPLGIHENIDQIENRPTSTFLYSVLAHKAIDPKTLKDSERFSE